MRRHRIFKRIPSVQSLKESPILKPFSRYLDHHFLWQFNRRAVAGGVAVGLFFGILSPIAQILLAAIAAIVLRVNLPVAAFGTFVTNPFTVPPLYYLAYKLGDFLTDPDTAEATEAGMSKSFYAQLGDAIESFPQFVEWAFGIGLPLLLGLGVLATVSAVSSYFGVNSLWKLSVRLRWSKRRQRQIPTQ